MDGLPSAACASCAWPRARTPRSRVAGHIDAISGTISSGTGAMSLRATFPNPERMLRNGSSATLVFPYQRDSVLVVPQEATYEIQDKVFAYRVVDGKATSAQVTVFPVSDGREYIVESGLKAGDVIVAEGAGLLQEGTTVAVPHPEDKNASI